MARRSLFLRPDGLAKVPVLKVHFHHMKMHIKYFINSQKWSEEEDIEMFYFSSFDESWKVGAEGDVGAYWGLWDKDENLKF